MYNCSKKHFIFVSASYMIHLLYEACTNFCFDVGKGHNFFNWSFWKINFFKPFMGVGHNFLAKLFLTLVARSLK